MGPKNKTIHVTEPTDGGNAAIAMTEPYSVQVKIQGDADLLFHRWNCEAIEEKAAAGKGSTAKKTDDTESYLWRDEKRGICVPGEYLRMSIVNAAKYRQDPRSPRKSAMDLYKAGVVCLTDLAPLGTKEPDYYDKRRAVINRAGINRTRPAMRKGWEAEFALMILVPELISQGDLRDVIGRAGKLVGIADFRPTFGRFSIVHWKVLPRE